MKLVPNVKKLSITTNEKGFPVVRNLEQTKQELKNILKGKDKLVVTTDEISVKTAQGVSTQLTKHKEDIKAVFSSEKKRIDEMKKALTIPEKELLEIIDSTQSEINQAIMQSKEIWKCEAVDTVQGEMKIEFPQNLFDSVKIDLRKTKDKLFKDIRAVAEKYVEEKEQKEKDLASLKEFCDSVKQPFDIWKLHLENKNLLEVMNLIGKSIEEQHIIQEEFQQVVEAKQEQKSFIEQVEAIVDSLPKYEKSVSYEEDSATKWYEQPKLDEYVTLTITCPSDKLDKLFEFCILEDIVVTQHGA